MKVIQAHDREKNLLCEFEDVPAAFAWYTGWKFSGRYCSGHVHFTPVVRPEGYVCTAFVPTYPNKGKPFECFSSTNLTMYEQNPTVQPKKLKSIPMSVDHPESLAGLTERPC